MAQPQRLDCRGLQPPEPMEQVLAKLPELGRDEQLLVLFDREPRPLLRILREDGYSHHVSFNDEGWFEVLIWQRF